MPKKPRKKKVIPLAMGLVEITWVCSNCMYRMTSSRREIGKIVLCLDCHEKFELRME